MLRKRSSRCRWTFDFCRSLCGHIHRPEIKELNGVLYCNDGDWIESCTALVEDETGVLSILNWAEERERLKLIYFEEKKKMKENAA